jgi:hypothetical protein
MITSNTQGKMVLLLDGWKEYLGRILIVNFLGHIQITFKKSTERQGNLGRQSAESRYSDFCLVAWLTRFISGRN